MTELKYYLRNRDAGQGWSFACGPAELFHYRDRLIVPNGKVLDIGSGYGRASMMFALEGMSVRALDTSEKDLRMYQQVAQEVTRGAYDLPPHPVDVEIELGDAEETDFGREEYDVVIMSEYPIHAPNRARGLNTIHRAAEAVKPGGHIYIKVVTKQDSAYRDYRADYAYHPNEPRVIDDDVIEVWCGCSGEIMREPILFFDTGDVLQTLHDGNCEIVYARHATTDSSRGTNVMFGEDETIQTMKDVGFSSVIGRKRF